MDGIYELKEMLCHELEEYGKKELSAGTLDIVDKLAHTIKNLDKIIEVYEDDEYSGGGGASYRGGSYMGGRSYARGRGRYARRDDMGRYSREADRLRSMMADAPDERTRQEMQSLASRLEMM